MEVVATSVEWISFSITSSEKVGFSDLFVFLFQKHLRPWAEEEPVSVFFVADVAPPCGHLINSYNPDKSWAMKSKRNTFSKALL